MLTGRCMMYLWIAHSKRLVKAKVSGIVSNYRARGSLDEYLASTGVVGLAGIDTRALVRRLRTRGAMKGILSTTDLDDAHLVAKAQSSPGLVGRDLVREVIPAGSIGWNEPLHPLAKLHQNAPPDNTAGGKRPHVVALDYGMKWNIARHLVDSGVRVTVLPGIATAEEVLALKPDGVFLSNGPGDPEPLDYAIRTIQGILGKAPVFGICLGHQLLSLASGAKTYKLKFGHRGANQPVFRLRTKTVEITCQNHGFAVDAATLPSNLEVTHLNSNDDTIEGVRRLDVPAFSVQYHPESSAGPHDSRYLFDEFRAMMGV